MMMSELLSTLMNLILALAHMDCPGVRVAKRELITDCESYTLIPPFHTNKG